MGPPCTEVVLSHFWIFLWGVVLVTQIILQHFCYNSNMIDWVIIYYFRMTPYFFFINQTLSRQRKIVKFFLILDFSLSPLTCMLHHQDLLVALYIKEKNPFIHWQKKKLAAALEHHQNLWPHIYKRKKKSFDKRNTCRSLGPEVVVTYEKCLRHKIYHNFCNNSSHGDLWMVKMWTWWIQSFFSIIEKTKLALGFKLAIFFFLKLIWLILVHEGTYTLKGLGLEYSPTSKSHTPSYWAPG